MCLANSKPPALFLVRDKKPTFVAMMIWFSFLYISVISCLARNSNSSEPSFEKV